MALRLPDVYKRQLLARGEALSAENQYRNIAQIADVVASLSQEYQVVIVHGNGPVSYTHLDNHTPDSAAASPWGAGLFRRAAGSTACHPHAAD